MKTIVADFKLIYFRLNLVGSRLESLVLEVWGRWESGSLKLWVRSMLSTFEKVAFHGGDFEGKYIFLIVLIFSKILKIWIRPQKIYYNFLLQFFGDGRG